MIIKNTELIKPKKICNLELVDYNTMKISYYNKNNMCVEKMFSFNNLSRKKYYEDILGVKYQVSKNMYKYHETEWIKIYKDNFVCPVDYSFIVDTYNNFILDMAKDISMDGNYFYDDTYFSLNANQCERLIFNYSEHREISVVCNLDFKKSEYIAYLFNVSEWGTNDTFIPIVSCNYICKFDNYIDFLNFNFKNAIDMEYKLSKIGTGFNLDNTIKLSARELIAILQKSKCSVSNYSTLNSYIFNDGLYLNYLENLILDFKIPYKSLKSMSTLAQSKLFVDCNVKELAKCLTYCFMNTHKKFSLNGLIYLFTLLNHNDFEDYNGNTN